jgi:hypothetical protein
MVSLSREKIVRHTLWVVVLAVKIACYLVVGGLWWLASSFLTFGFVLSMEWIPQLEGISGVHFYDLGTIFAVMALGLHAAFGLWPITSWMYKREVSHDQS